MWTLDKATTSLSPVIYVGNRANGGTSCRPVVIMWWRSAPKCTRLKDRDYDVTPRIILILSLTCTPKCTRGRRRFARCSVDIVGEECEVYWSAKSGRWSVGRGEVKTLVVVSSVTRSVQW